MGIVGHNENKRYLHDENSRKRRENKRIDSIFEALMAKNFLNLGREINIQIPEAQRNPNRLILNRTIPRHIVSKLSKEKRKKEF